MADQALICRLRSNSSAQHYRVRDGIEPTAYEEVCIWCRRYAVPLCVAKIAP